MTVCRTCVKSKFYQGLNSLGRCQHRLKCLLWKQQPHSFHSLSRVVTCNRGGCWSQPYKSILLGLWCLNKLVALFQGWDSSHNEPVSRLNQEVRTFYSEAWSTWSRLLAFWPLRLVFQVFTRSLLTSKYESKVPCTLVLSVQLLNVRGKFPFF